jgi:Sulfotransferase domain
LFQRTQQTNLELTEGHPSAAKPIGSAGKDTLSGGGETNASERIGKRQLSRHLLELRRSLATTADSAEVICAAKHVPIDSLRRTFEQARIFWVIRDPRDVLISYFYHDLASLGLEKLNWLVKANASGNSDSAGNEVTQRTRVNEDCPDSVDSNFANLFRSAAHSNGAYVLRSDAFERWLARRAETILRFYRHSESGISTWQGQYQSSEDSARTSKKTSAGDDLLFIFRYEDFVQKPESALARIAEALKLSVDSASIKNIVGDFSMDRLLGTQRYQGVVLGEGEFLDQESKAAGACSFVRRGMIGEVSLPLGL